MPIKNLLSLPHWKARLLMWGAAAAVGVAAVAFAKIADFAQAAIADRTSPAQPVSNRQ
jgi:NADPH:quinone reductase-like Zn-dependent oxidoreductase